MTQLVLIDVRISIEKNTGPSKINLKKVKRGSVSRTREKYEQKSGKTAINKNRLLRLVKLYEDNQR